VRTNIVANGRNMGADQAGAFARVARTSPARTIVEGIKNNRQRVFVGVESKIMATAKRIAPGPMVALTGMISERGSERATTSRSSRSKAATAWVVTR
jgi:hypothetical protein